MYKLSMKQMSIIVSVTVFSILLFAVIIILNFTKGEVRVDVLKEQTKVGLILNGPADDRSWSMSHYTALEDISEELNLLIVCKENVPENESCLKIFDALADEGCRIVIADSYGYGSYIEQAAKEHPDIYFMHASGSGYGKNFGSFFGRMYQFRYLSGIVAGIRTKTDSIGYVAAFPISEVNRGINAFALGVRSVNPDASVHVKFCDSWTEDKPARECTRELIDNYGADVIAMHTNSLAPLDEAEQSGVWSIGYNLDNSERYPKSYLTACVWDWKGYYREQILLCLQGKFRGEHKWLGIESGVMKLIDGDVTDNADPACRQPVEDARRRFETYSYDVFYGPIKDSDGNIRIDEGESMSDENMLENFDWYVEGVEID